MIDLVKLKKEFENCPCGVKHELSIKEIAIGSGITPKTGEILSRNGFTDKLLFIADKNTLKAADGIKGALKDFTVVEKIYENLREATVSEVENVKKLLKG